MNVVFEYKDWYFEWDSEKDVANIQKHGVSFEHAAVFFRDGESIMDPDYRHSTMEERWIVLGLDNRSQILGVCVTWREIETGATSYRIISAREISAKQVPRYRKWIVQRAK
ncbi:MAG: BrnT family toxin [Limisphaerales bacterium]